MAEINTRIILRNDTAENWEKSTLKLKGGEAAVEIINGKAKLKIATADDQDFANAPYIGGAESNVFQVELDTTETDIEAAIGNVVGDTELAIGDIAIVKAAIGDSDKTSYTSYVYDKIGVNEDGSDDFAWVAMDGNYSAANVYLPKDITLAGDFASVGNYNKGDKINKGTSLETLFNGMLQKELYPTTNDKPNTEITASGNSGEVGTQYDLPTATLKIKDVGSFEYGDKATGITFAIGDVKLVQGSDPTSTTATNTKTNSEVMTKDSTITLKATDTNAVNGKLYYGDTSKSFTFTGTAKYSDSVIPETNLGNPYPASQIKSATITLDANNGNTHKTVSFSGYRYAFAGATTADAIDSAIARAMTAKKSSKASMDSEGEALEFTAAQGATKVFFTYPATWTGTPYFEMFGLAWAENTDIVAKDNIQVADARGTVDGALQGATAYKLYCWELDTPLQAESTKFRVWFK